MGWLQNSANSLSVPNRNSMRSGHAHRKHAALVWQDTDKTKPKIIGNLNLLLCIEQFKDCNPKKYWLSARTSVLVHRPYPNISFIILSWGLVGMVSLLRGEMVINQYRVLEELHILVF